MGRVGGWQPCGQGFILSRVNPQGSSRRLQTSQTMYLWWRWQFGEKHHYPSFFKNSRSEPGRDVQSLDAFHWCKNSQEISLFLETGGRRKTLGQQGTTQCALDCSGARDPEKGAGGRERQRGSLAQGNGWIPALTVCGSINSTAALLVRNRGSCLYSGHFSYHTAAVMEPVALRAKQK